MITQKAHTAHTNTAYVYLPYGYEEETQTHYNVLYSVHGHYGTASTTFEAENGDMTPTIVVSPSYNYGSPTTNHADADHYCEAPPTKLVNDLIPIVESRYCTYAGSTDAAGMNRPDAKAESLAGIVSDSPYSGTGFYIWSASGTSDSVYRESTGRHTPSTRKRYRIHSRSGRRGGHQLLQDCVSTGMNGQGCVDAWYVHHHLPTEFIPIHVQAWSRTTYDNYPQREETETTAFVSIPFVCNTGQRPDEYPAYETGNQRSLRYAIALLETYMGKPQSKSVSLMPVSAARKRSKAMIRNTWAIYERCDTRTDC